jgi:hypothetical protein
METPMHTVRLVLPAVSLAATLLCGCGQANIAPVANDAWAKSCGGCHFAYQPGLLPTASWTKLLGSPNEHFGQKLELDAKALAALTEYAVATAADKSASRRSAKIVRSLQGATPTRVTEVPAFREKHRKIAPAVFKRKAIGSLGNCPACHRDAQQGVYEEHGAVIPKE